jgi:hypothetical protein
MGMAGPDIVLFVVGFLLVAGAGYALVAQGGLEDGGGSPTNTYSVLFPLSKVEAGKANVPDFASASLTIPVTTTNVTKMTVTLACNDAVPGGTFNLQVEIEPPNGIEPVTKGATCDGSVEIDVPVAEVPPPTAAAGADRATAAATVGQSPDAAKAVGDWKITIGGARGGSGGLPIQPPGSPSGSVTLNAQQWAPELTPVVK